MTLRTRFTAAIYLRAKSADQAQARRLQRQRKAVRALADRLGYDVAAEYVDTGVTGIVPFAQRPAGAELLAAAKRGEFTIVLAEDWDRLARDSSILDEVLRLFRSAGLGVATMADPIGILAGV